MNFRKIGAVLFIIVGIIILFIGLNYGLFTISAIISTILSAFIVSIFGAGIFLFKPEDNTKSQLKIRKSKFPYLGSPKFDAKIKDNKGDYDRKTDEVIFTLSYKGKIKQGFVACEIIPPDLFLVPPSNSDDKGHISIFYDETIKQNNSKQTIKNIEREIANLSGKNITIDNLEWSWKIPQFASLRDYEAIIGIWDFSKDKDRPELIQHVKNTFTVGDDNPSHYMQRVNI